MDVRQPEQWQATLAGLASVAGQLDVFARHGDAVHTFVGKTARRLAFAARWMPGRLRKGMRALVLGG
jgi:hypothetical protein